MFIIRILLEFVLFSKTLVIFFKENPRKKRQVIWNQEYSYRKLKFSPMLAGLSIDKFLEIVVEGGPVPAALWDI